MAKRSWAGLEMFRATLPEYRRYEGFRFYGLSIDIVKAQYIIYQDLVPNGIIAPLTAQVADWAKFFGFAPYVPPEERDPKSLRMYLFGPTDKQQDYAVQLSDEALERPLIFGTFTVLSGREKGHTFPMVIDGLHRLYAAWHRGIDVLPAYQLTLKETKECM